MPVLSPDKGGRRSRFKYFEFLIEYTAVIICEYNENIYQDDSFIIRVINNSYNVLFLFKRTVVLSYYIAWKSTDLNYIKCVTNIEKGAKNLSCSTLIKG